MLYAPIYIVFPDMGTFHSHSCNLSFMLTLVFGMPVSKGKLHRSLDFCLIAKETIGDCEQGFVFKHVYMCITKQAKHFHFLSILLLLLLLTDCKIYLLQFSHIWALFCLHLEGGIIQQPFKSCLASVR